MPQTTVVSVRLKEIKKMGYNSFQEWVDDPDNVYIGRINQHVAGTFNSKWRNRYSVKKYGRDKCIEMYEDSFRYGELAQLQHFLPELVGKRLGCWCAPEACHGHVLLHMIHEMGLEKENPDDEDEEEFDE